ncbi:MAG: hypothetical protein M1819_006197 [Sarea resinae]|nr:MAG: hypothetical protein M1819_006197 [Sarea resinae]
MQEWPAQIKVKATRWSTPTSNGSSSARSPSSTPPSPWSAKARASAKTASPGSPTPRSKKALQARLRGCAVDITAELGEVQERANGDFIERNRRAAREYRDAKELKARRAVRDPPELVSGEESEDGSDGDLEEEEKEEDSEAQSVDDESENSLDDDDNDDDDNDDDAGDSPEPAPPKAKSNPGKSKASTTKRWDIEGAWEISCPYIEDNWGGDEDGLTLDVFSSGNQISATFDFTVVTGVFRFCDPSTTAAVHLKPAAATSSSKNKRKRNDAEDTAKFLFRDKKNMPSPSHTTLPFRWRGEETGEHEIQLGSDEKLCSVTFRSAKKLEGFLEGAMFAKTRFTGTKLGAASSKGPDPDGQWSNRDERAYEEARRNRW